MYKGKMAASNSKSDFYLDKKTIEMIAAGFCFLIFQSGPKGIREAS